MNIPPYSEFIYTSGKRLNPCRNRYFQW